MILLHRIGQSKWVMDSLKITCLTPVCTKKACYFVKWGQRRPHVCAKYNITNRQAYEYYRCTPNWKKETFSLFFRKASYVRSKLKQYKMGLRCIMYLNNIPVQGQILKVTHIEMGFHCCPEERCTKMFATVLSPVLSVTPVSVEWSDFC